MARSKGPAGDGLDQRLAEARRAKRDRRGAINRDWARRELDKLAAKREIEADPTGAVKNSKRSKKTKGGAKPRGQSKAMIAQAIERSEVNKLVSKEAQRQGDYRFVPVTLIEVTEGGKPIKKESKAVRNMGGSPVERWAARGRLDERQIQAILFYQDAFRKVFGEGPRMSASYSPVIIRGLRASIELWAGSTLAAREALRLLDQEVFFRLPMDHFPVWQNVVIWDEPAGIAGSRLGFCHKPAEAVALEIVRTMASMVADIVIDSSRRDFGDLIVDIDAPRRPGRRS